MLTTGLIIAFIFGIAAEMTLARPEHNIEVEQTVAKIKAEREARSMQVVVFDRMERVGEHYLPVSDTAYIFTDH